jgi:hypothetical protein
MGIVDIPGGQATLRDPEELRQRQVRQVQRVAFAAAAKLGIDPDKGDIDLGMALANAAQLADPGEMLDVVADVEVTGILVFLESWTRPDALPTTADQVDDLPNAVYKALTIATAPLLAEVVSGASFDATPDKGSPTGPSSGSDQPLRDTETSA